MKRQYVTQNQQQKQSNTPLRSGILQRAAVRSIPEQQVQTTDCPETNFHQDFTRIPVQTKRESVNQTQRLNQQEQKSNNTGLPDTLKAGIENLSGMTMDDVKVHYNSSKPAHLQALAYTQGTDIHLASGQEKHLAHEAWHVVQQKEGRVKPTLQTKGVAINNDNGLEKEADDWALKASKIAPSNHDSFLNVSNKSITKPIVQGMWRFGRLLSNIRATKSHSSPFLRRSHSSPSLNISDRNRTFIANGIDNSYGILPGSSGKPWIAPQPIKVNMDKGQFGSFNPQNNSIELNKRHSSFVNQVTQAHEVAHAAHASFQEINTTEDLILTEFTAWWRDALYTQHLVKSGQQPDITDPVGQGMVLDAKEFLKDPHAAFIKTMEAYHTQIAYWLKRDGIEISPSDYVKQIVSSIKITGPEAYSLEEWNKL